MSKVQFGRLTRISFGSWGHNFSLNPGPPPVTIDYPAIVDYPVQGKMTIAAEHADVVWEVFTSFVRQTLGPLHDPFSAHRPTRVVVIDSVTGETPPEPTDADRLEIWLSMRDQLQPDRLW